MWLSLDPDVLMPVGDAIRWVARSGPMSKQPPLSIRKHPHTSLKSPKAAFTFQAIVNESFHSTPMFSRTLGVLFAEGD